MGRFVVLFVSSLLVIACAKPTWSDVSGVPSGFADDVDNDTLGALSCADGMAPRWSDAAKAWQCSAPSGASWATLQGIPASFADGVDADSLAALSCSAGDVPTWYATAPNWRCAADRTGPFTDTGSSAYYSGGNVGIGTASPGQKLTVAGTIETTTGGVKFPDGTTQTTAAKPGIGVLANGTQVGLYLGLYLPYYFVLTSTDFIFAVDVTTGKVVNQAGGGGYLLPLYQSANCTGTPYANGMLPGMVVVKSGTSELFYIPKGATTASITIGSYYDANGSCTTSTGGYTAYALTANNPTVTGISTASLALPITLSH